MRAVFIIIIGLFLTGCKSQKVLNNSEKSFEFKQHTDTVFISKTEKITDTLFIQVPSIKTINPECDSLCEQELRNALQLLSFRKKSSGTNAGAYYDLNKNQWVWYQNLQEQFSIYSSKNKDTIHYKEVLKEIPIRYIPYWIKVLAWIGCISLLAIVTYIILKIKNFIKI